MIFPISTSPKKSDFPTSTTPKKNQPKKKTSYKYPQNIQGKKLVNEKISKDKNWNTFFWKKFKFVFFEKKIGYFFWKKNPQLKKKSSIAKKTGGRKEADPGTRGNVSGPPPMCRDLETLCPCAPGAQGSFDPPPLIIIKIEVGGKGSKSDTTESWIVLRFPGNSSTRWRRTLNGHCVVLICQNSHYYY